MDLLFYVVMLLGFVAVVALIEGLYIAWNRSFGEEAKKIRQRLVEISASGNGSGTTSIVRQRLLSKTPAVARFLLSLPRIHDLDRFLIQSGLSWSVSQLLGYMLGAGIIVAFACWMLDFPYYVTVGLGTGGVFLPLLYASLARAARLQKIEGQLPEALELMSRAMRAGHAFAGALQMVGQESPEPLATEFRTTFDEINYGISSEDALKHLAKRVPSSDLRYFVVAVSIQRSTGGDLAEILDNIASIVRARLKLFGTIRVLSAEGRLSAWILTILPFVLAGVIHSMNPKFLSVLWTDQTGLRIVGFAMGLMLIGIIWMWRLIKIRV